MLRYTPYQILINFEKMCREAAIGLPSQDEDIQYFSGVCFRLGDYMLISSMGDISEVLTEQSYTGLLGVKSWVKGIANVRGSLLPVLDMNQFFDFENTGTRKSRRMLVVGDSDVFFGFIVSEVFGMKSLAVTDYHEGAPDGIDARLKNCVNGYFEHNEEKWLVFVPYLLNKDTEFIEVTAKSV